MKHITIIILLLPAVIFCSKCTDQKEDKQAELALTVLRYNNPDLVVNLGVGLWAWPLPMDYDRDGDLDLVVSCPDTPFNGLHFFENTSGTGVAFPVFKPPVKIGPGQKNMQVCYVNDEPRVLGQAVQYRHFRDSVLADPLILFDKEEIEDAFESIRFSQWKYVDYENDGDLDLIAGIDDWGDYGWDDAFDDEGKWTNGPLHGYVFLIENVEGEYVNKGKIEAGGKPIDVYGAPSPNMMDFDGDGDLDIICGEFVDRFTWFENTGTREHPVYAKGRFLENEGGIIKMHLEMIIPSAVDWDADGDIDLVVGDEDGRVALVENTGVVQDRMPVFKSPVYFQQEAGLVKFGALATPVAVDWDDDGDEDLISGNTAGHIGFIENLDGGNPPKWNRPVYLEAEGKMIRIMAGDSGSIQGPAEKKWGYTTLSVADWDGDGLRDIIVNSIWGKIEWFKNVGEKGEPEMMRRQAITAEFGGDPPKPAWNWWDPEDNHLVTQWRTTPVASDWTGDGLVDLVMLDTEGYLSLYERFRKDDGSLGLQPGQRIFYGTNASVFSNKNNVEDSTAGVLRLNYREAGGSGRRKMCLSDWDSDGDIDLIVNSTNASLFIHEKTEDGKVYFRHAGPLAERRLAGHTTSPTTVDWNGDGTPDLLIGAEDGHFYYLERNK